MIKRGEETDPRTLTSPSVFLGVRLHRLHCMRGVSFVVYRCRTWLGWKERGEKQSRSTTCDNKYDEFRPYSSVHTLYAENHPLMSNEDVEAELLLDADAAAVADNIRHQSVIRPSAIQSTMLLVCSIVRGGSVRTFRYSRHHVYWKHFLKQSFKSLCFGWVW